MEHQTPIQKVRQAIKTQLMMQMLAKQTGQESDPTETLLMQKLKGDFLSKNRQKEYLEMMAQYLSLTTDKAQVSQVLTKFLNLTPQEQSNLEIILKAIYK